MSQWWYDTNGEPVAFTSDGKWFFKKSGEKVGHREGNWLYTPEGQQIGYFSADEKWIHGKGGQPLWYTA
jgi:hypothetical protein